MTLYSDALYNVNLQQYSNIRFYDLPNMLGQLTTYIHQNHLQDQILKNGNYVGKMLTDCFHRLENLLASQYFPNLIKTIKHTGIVPHHTQFGLDRIFIKQSSDLMLGNQITETELIQLLPYPSNCYVIQSEIKKIMGTGKNRYKIYCDIDFQMIHALTELLYYCRYEKNYIEYLIIGSGDKDYSKVCQMAKDDGIVIVSVSIMGEGMSQNMLNCSDIAFILFPKLCILKPYHYRLEELMENKVKKNGY